MRKLNLEAKGKEQELVKAYLEETASEELARKINAGVIVEQDGKQLINKKSLNEFMVFAGKEAQKLAEKGVNCACIEENTVYGWAVHFFEEESIIGTLYNPDGTKYVKPKPKTTKPTNTVSSYVPPKPKHEQTSFFDLSAMVNTPNKEEKDDKEEVDEKIDEEVEEEIEENEKEDEEEQETVVETKKELPKGNTLYQTYCDVKDSYVTSVIAMRVGDFYEIFGQDAVTFANILDLTLTGRDCGLDHRIPMIGFPYHCADAYLDKISEHSAVITVEINGTFIDSIPQKAKEEKKVQPEEEVLKEFYSSKENTGNILKEENDLMKAFEKTSLMILLELFEDNATIG